MKKSLENKQTKRFLLWAGRAWPGRPAEAALPAPPCRPRRPPHMGPGPTALGPLLSCLPSPGSSRAPSPAGAHRRGLSGGSDQHSQGTRGVWGAMAARGHLGLPAGQGLASFGAGMCFTISGILLIIIAVINTKGILAVFLSAQPLCL